MSNGFKSFISVEVPLPGTAVRASVQGRAARQRCVQESAGVGYKWYCVV